MAMTMKMGTCLDVTRLKNGREIPYIRICAGPYRNKYVHRMVAEALLRRRLTPMETVHHKDQNSMNPDPANLMVLTWVDHGVLTRMLESKQLALSGLVEGEDYKVILDGGKVMAL